MLRVVLDTNVFVSSILSKAGAPAQALQAWHSRQYLLITSPMLIAELQHTLNYDRLRHKYGITDQDVAELTTLLEKEALVVPGQANVWGAIPEDPDDEQVIACAVDGQADFVVSGDRHLLTLGVYRGIPILTVRDFLDKLAEQ